MPGSERRGAKFARRRQQVAKFDRPVAFDTGHRRFAGGVAIGKAVDDLLAKPAFVVQHVMRNAKARGDIAGIVDVLPGAARTLAMGGGAVIVKLQRNADDVVTLRLEQRGRGR